MPDTEAVVRNTIKAILAIVFVLSLPSTVLAQTRIGVTLSPPILEDNVKPGNTMSYKLHLTNEGETSELLFPRLYEVVGMTKDGQPKFANSGENTPYALASWITFDQKSIDLAPRGSADLTFTVHVPEEATPGAHIGSIALSREAPTNIKMGTGIAFEVRSIISLKVAGEVIEKTRIKEFFTGQVFFTKADVHFTTTVENAGNVFAKPHGLIDIRNMLGTKVDTIPVNDGMASVFPNDERSFTSDWTSEKFQIGKFSADITLNVEGTKGVQALLSKVEFWVIPTNIVLPVLGGLLLFLLIFWLLLKIYVRNQIRRATGGRVSARAREATSLSRLSVVVIGLLISVIIGLILLLFMLG